MNYDFDDLGRIVFESGSVKLKPYIPRQPKPVDLMTDAELMNGAGGTLAVDLESYVNYFLIAFKDMATGKVAKFEIDADTGECFNERKLSWILHSYTTVGFNSIKFDMPLIWLAYVNQNTEILKQATNDLIFLNVWYNQLAKQYNFEIHETPHIDLIEVCPLKGSLKLYGARLHSKRLQDLPIEHNKRLTDEEKAIVADYCINSDLPGTKLLFDNLEEQLKLRRELSNQYQVDLMSKSDAQIAEAVIGKELQKITGKWPKKPPVQAGALFNYDIPPFIFFQTEKMQKVLQAVSQAQYEVLESGKVTLPNEIKGLKINIGNGIYRMGNGGLHSSEKNIAVKADDEYDLVDRDVASYYPAIVLNSKLFPPHLGEDFLTVYSTLRTRRLEAKKAKNIAVSECIKITINGTFGKLGSPFSILYAPKLMVQVTITGQLGLLMLIEYLDLQGFEIVSANTDGIVIRCKKTRREELNQIFKMWEQITGFETEETEYAAVYSRDVNAYMAVKKPKDGKSEIKGKNVYYDPWRGKSAKDGYWRFQKNPNCQICVEAVERMITDNIPVDKTIQECTDFTKFVAVKNVKGGAHKDGYYLGKVVRWYYARGILGTINYISNDNKVPDTDGAKPCMDLPDEFPTDIDYNWYVAKATEMLYDMAFLNRPKQIQFF